MATSILPRRRRVAQASIAALLTVLASTANADDIGTLQAEIATLRAEQIRIAELQARTERALIALEARLTSAGSAAGGAPAPAGTSSQEAPRAAPPSRPGTSAATNSDSRWTIAGDFRLRGQGDYSDDRAPARNSAQVRGRLSATYKLSDRVSFGTRIVTGDPDDPNSTDVQLSNWIDDLQISADLAYVQVKLSDFMLYGGKFPQPFTRTDLVWDGDVNPQGVGATFKRLRADGSAIRGNGALLVIDEQAAGPDSTMAGLQLGYDSAAIGQVRFDASLGYYHYDLGSTAGADTGDFRSNLRNPDGSYVSDFRLLDLVAGVTWQAGPAKWPLKMVLDLDKNLGAAAGRDTAWGIDLIAGRASQAGDWRASYGYSQAEVDSVLAAFSHDNIGIGTNYALHALMIDYTPFAKMQISGIWYHYRPKDALYAGALAPSDWLDRFRLYFQVAF